MTATVSQESGTYRIETKYLCRAHELTTMLYWIRTHAAAFRETYPLRRINNIYFDTHTLAAYHDNLAGISVRNKLRYRWYGEEPHPSSGQLEVKMRRNCYGSKLSFTVENAWDASRPTWAGIATRIHALAPQAARPWLMRFPDMTLVNSYRRCYFETCDHSVRLTIDTDLRFGYAPSGDFPDVTALPIPQECVVIELKAPMEMSRRMNAIVQGFPFRISRFSKYVMGIKSSRGSSPV